MSKRQNCQSLRVAVSALTVAIIFTLFAVGCDDYSHNSIVNTPPANYVNLLAYRTFGGLGYDWGAAITTTAEGDYIITGSTNSNGYGDNTVYLAKVNSSGSLVWYNWAGGWGDDNGLAVAMAPDGNIIVAGYTTSYDVIEGTKIDPNSGKPVDDYSVFLAKVLPDDGEKAWESAFGDTAYVERGYALALSSDAYYVAGYQHRTESEEDVYIIKADLNGDSVWQKTFGTDNIDRALSIVRTSDGNFVVGGFTRPTGTNKSNAYLLKINPDGDQLWERIHSDNDYGLTIYSIIQTSDGGLVAACAAMPVSSEVGTSNTLYVIRMNADGTAAWKHSYTQSGINEPRTIIESADGGFIVMGQYYAEHKPIIAKIDAEGNFVWSDDAGGVAGYGMSMAPFAGGYVVTGSTTYPNHESLNDVMFFIFEEDLTNLQ